MTELDVQTRAGSMKTLSRSEAAVPLIGVIVVGAVNLGALGAAIYFAVQGDAISTGIFAGIVGVFTAESFLRRWRGRD